MTVDRGALLEQHGRAYGEMHAAVTFTDGINGDAAKRVRSKGWPATTPLPDGDFGAALLKGRGRNHNPAIVLGASGLVGIDIDGSEGAQLLRRLHPAPLPRTVTAVTNGGWHLWYRRPDELNGVVKIELGPEGLEIAKEGYLVCPPALHPSGAVYTFAADLAPWDVSPATLTSRELEPLLAHASKSRAVAVASTGPIQEGGRHRHLRRVAGAMVRVGASEAAVLVALLTENEHRCQPPKDERIVRELARDIATRYRPEATA